MEINRKKKKSIKYHKKFEVPNINLFKKDSEAKKEINWKKKVYKNNPIDNKNLYGIDLTKINPKNKTLIQRISKNVQFSMNSKFLTSIQTRVY